MGKGKKRKMDSGGTSNSGHSVKIEIEGVHDTASDDPNALVMMPRRKKKKDDEKGERKMTKKKLSKKERKRLLDVIKRKENKDRRAELLETLSKHQASDEMLKQFSSITEVYAQNFKSIPSADDTFEMKANSIKGGKKKNRLLTPKPEKEEAESTDTDEMSTDEEVEQNIQALTQQAEEGEEEEEEESKMEEESVDSSKQTEESRKEEKAEKSKETSTGENASKPVTTSKTTTHLTRHVAVNRKTDVQEARLKLPILAEEQVVMETINENPVVIVCGETGSGKTTQVPQFLYEAGYAHDHGIIGVTEPRRVAAISMSKRVAHEMNLSSREVSYQIRFEGNTTPDTKIKFLTDGVLLKEAQKDPLLSKYTVIIIDEAHERSVYTDILIGLLSIIVRQREKRGKPLKLIIMSATLRVEDFTGPKLFRYEKPPSVVKVEARQFPVTVHFNKCTPDNYVTEAFRKICKIHRTLPDGGILVFVTGQQEIHTLIRKLRRMFPYIKGNALLEPTKKESRRARRHKEMEKNTVDEVKQLPQFSLDNYSVAPEDEQAENDEGPADHSDDDLDEGDSDDEDAMRARLGEDKPDSSIPLYVLPLFSLLSSDKQAKVFEPPPEGCRLCVVATNVAETSLTIPNIRYVVDTGKTKTKYFDKVTGVSTFRVTWVSQASADQRAGRAGRMGPGHCYRLYSSAVFGDFSKFAPPEITRRPVEDLVLQMKSMRIDKVANFPFPTPPDNDQIKAAETLLISLGALKPLAASMRLKDLKKAPSPVITDLGVVMATFPVSPRYAKMLTLGLKFNVLPYVIALVAALSVEEVFENSIQPSDLEEEQQEVLHKKLAKMEIFKSRLMGNSLLLGDMMVLLSVVGACASEGCSPSFCYQLGVRYKAMVEIRKLRVQLTNAANVAYQDFGLDLTVDPKLPPPTEDQVLTLRKVILGGLADHVARRNPAPPTGSDKVEVKKLKGSFRCMQIEDLSYIHPESVFYKNQDVEFVVYQAMMETSRIHMRVLCCVEPHWFPVMAPSYCMLSKPLEDPPPRYDDVKGSVVCHRSGSFGRCNWEFPPVELDFPDGTENYRWFAKFLLEGEVFPKLRQFTSSLLLTPSTMVKSWAMLQKKTDSLLKALLGRGTNTKQSLMKVWKKEPTFLQSQYLEWVKESQHPDVMKMWPPLEEEET